ncbi:MAG: radical SAM protein [Anaerolineaceae bacterium]|nr:radical SAM protein [Anaerolineaceae bacterium]
MAGKSLYLIPFQDKYLIYRPLRGLLFLGNRAMADCAQAFCENMDRTVLADEPEVLGFFDAIGFTRPDPPEPPDPDLSVYLPTSAALLMSNRCNLRCIYCYANGGETNNLDLDPAIARAAIDQVCENAQKLGQDRFLTVFHGGGEPTVHWDALVSLAEYARSKPLPAVLETVTNGCWNEEQGEFLMKWIDGMTISMDGAAETQNLQRPLAGGQGSFRRVMRSVDQLSRAGYPFNIRMTVIPERFDRLPEDVRFLCENTGCREIQAEPAFFQVRGRHGTAYRDQGQRFADAFLEAWEIANAKGIVLYYSGARPETTSSVFCQAPLGESLTVNPLGQVTGCYETTGRDGQCGGVFGYADASGIHIDEETRIRQMTEILHRKDKCGGCFCYYHCSGDCFTRGTPAEDGPWPYNRCEINRRITLELLLRKLSANAS